MGATGVTEAVENLATGRVSGAGGLPPILYENTQVLEEVSVTAFNASMRQGRLRRGSTSRHVWRRGEDAGLCASRRPISLMCPVIKTLDGALCRLMIAGAEFQLDPRQSFRGRGGGAEMVLGKARDFNRRSLNRSQCMCAVSFDVAGAFVCVPHHRLMGTMERRAVCPYPRPLAHGRLRGRPFQVQPRAPRSWRRVYLRPRCG